MNTPELTPLVPLVAEQWLIVNDNVMGGRSTGAFSVNDGVLQFAGRLNTRGGGFASIRSRGLLHSLAPFRGVTLRVRGDGRRYSCDLRATPRLAGREATWKAMFETTPEVWTQVRLPFATFVPTWRGRTLDPATEGGTGSLAGRSGSIGVTIADGVDGPFALEIAAIGAY